MWKKREANIWWVLGTGCFWSKSILFYQCVEDECLKETMISHLKFQDTPPREIFAGFLLIFLSLWVIQNSVEVLTLCLASTLKLYSIKSRINVMSKAN